MHYLKRELYDLVENDRVIFDFLQIGSLDGLWYWDLENPEHEWMSPEFWRLFGIDPETKTHSPDEWQDLIHPDDLALALDNFHKHLADPDHPYDQIVRYRHAQGHMVTVRCRGLAIRDDTGKPIRMLGAHNDLTELKASEEALARKNAELAEEVKRANSAVAARTAFLATMSHETRTPLNVILGLLYLIKTDETASEKTRERADVGHRAAEQLLSQLVNVLEVARLDADAVSVNLKPMEIAGLAALWRKTIEGAAGRYGKVLDTEIVLEGDIPEQVWVDSDKVTQIVTNLIDNAVKFVDAGCISIRISYEPASSLPLSINVLDTGPGIPPEERSRVLQRFVQLENTKLLHKGGSGLGLSICQELASVMGGELRFCDDPPAPFNLGIMIQLPDKGGETPR